MSDLHRKWGYDCPAIDIDFLMLEYDLGEPIALVEYKNEHAKPQVASHPSYRALISLGNRASLPVFCVRYADDFSWWKIVPLNDHAKEHCPARIKMTQQEYISFLYGLRGREYKGPGQ